MDNVDNFVDKMWITIFQSGMVQIPKIERFTMPDYNHRKQAGIIATDQLQSYYNTVLL